MRLIDADRVTRKLPKRHREIIATEHTVVDLKSMLNDINRDIRFIKKQKESLILRNNILDTARVTKLAKLNGKLEVLSAMQHNLMSILL